MSEATPSFPIEDGTAAESLIAGAPLLADLIATEMAALEGRIGRLASSVAEGSEYLTDRGARHVVVYNGEIKEEGALGRQVVVSGDFSALAQLGAIRGICAGILRAVSSLKDGGDRLVWRRRPSFSRWLAADGLHIAVSVRLAFD